jgi:hypothetical protein
LRLPTKPASGLGRELGRIERTLFALDWMQNVELRRRVQIGLNKGEAKNGLARAVFLNRVVRGYSWMIPVEPDIRHAHFKPRNRPTFPRRQCARRV